MSSSEKMRRGERLVALVRTLVDQPGRLFPLSRFASVWGAARSTISEDLALIKETLEAHGLGHVETVAGAGGGARFFPVRARQDSEELVRELAALLSAPDRILPGGFLYMSDVIFSPWWATAIGEIFATRFHAREPDYVLTVETKGISLAFATARALGIPLVVIRRDSRVTEGPAVSINYVSGSGDKIETMSLPRRALPLDSRVLLVDDFMRGGGTARGMIDLMREFNAEVVGLAVLIETAWPARKLVTDYDSLLVLERVDTSAGEVEIRPRPAAGNPAPGPRDGGRRASG